MKAIAVDIDGTITDPTRKLSIPALKALRKSESLGVPVILVTGNILCFTRAASVLIGTSGGLVAENGGVIYSNEKVKVLGDIKKAEKAYEHLRSLYPVEKVQFSEFRVSEIAIWRTVPKDVIKEALRDFDIEVYDTKFAIHLTDPRVNKGSSLKLVAEDMGIKTDDIIAIGDSENDIDFLKVAGLKVAVANADPQLKKMADYVTTKKYGDGVAEALEKLIFRGGEIV
ncbi:MAG TPA: phosphoglycolate phosphatase [Methanothermobacter sp.]|jgi:phosphoglycolate phosphatase (TIGR01487 family)|uniref:Phosphoglycolate phosphatase n=1 Tax=Methanothermobacter tenebrarum TaxID=680118 RepID=A0ABM7YC18_9EURY|nr:phosphoglycolate phosphatase [Methanothermobacter tenebrarum]MDD3455056.1 phosphoglycolate phosphatase [Methanobacteriales archaeon]MDI6882013.1 phosphoglycolate phosphatase [Methanothermobacter sp.]MDX9693433.1 phosphoglycolate phosphatase [Methanothermobacter sp.]BDH78984.1 phosphoglycolate phosphatase [Methanothermobacter tenebrarum]HHW16883.1 phosphoglycolate phosphatase [Methanothermobacter sp.]